MMLPLPRRLGRPQVSKAYPGRASAAPIVDLFITLLAMGKVCWQYTGDDTDDTDDKDDTDDTDDDSGGDAD